MATKELNGISYFQTETDGNGHEIATYLVYLESRPIMRVLVDQTATVEAKSLGGAFAGVPAGIQAGPIFVRRVDSEFDGFEPATATKGHAIIAEHTDGTGTHADGQTVQAFVIPRLAFLLADLYVPKA